MPYSSSPYWREIGGLSGLSGPTQYATLLNAGVARACRKNKSPDLTVSP